MPSKRTLVLLLGGVAGAVDAIGYVTLFHLFTANMTGNTVKAARGLTAHAWRALAWHGFPIAMFVLGAIVGAVVARFLRSRPLALGLEIVALVVFALLASSRDFGELHWLTAAMPALAMGIQSVTVRRCGHATVQTAFLSGVLVSFADALVSWMQSRRPSAAARARLVLGVWACYALGAVAGFTAHARWGASATLLPICALALSMGISAGTAASGSSSRRRGPPRAPSASSRTPRPPRGDPRSTGAA